MLIPMLGGWAAILSILSAYVLVWVVVTPHNHRCQCCSHYAIENCAPQENEVSLCELLCHVNMVVVTSLKLHKT